MLKIHNNILYLRAVAAGGTISLEGKKCSPIIIIYVWAYIMFGFYYKVPEIEPVL